MSTKTIHTDQGTFIVDESMEGDFDPSSMLPDEPEEFYSSEQPTGPTPDVLIVNGEKISGRLKVYKTTINGITGKTIVRVVLEV